MILRCQDTTLPDSGSGFLHSPCGQSATECSRLESRRGLLYISFCSLATSGVALQLFTPAVVVAVFNMRFSVPRWLKCSCFCPNFRHHDDDFPASRQIVRAAPSQQASQAVARASASPLKTERLSRSDSMIAGMLTKRTTLGLVGQKVAINTYGLSEVVPERGIASSAAKASNTSESHTSEPLVATQIASEGLASRTASIKAAHPLRQHSASSSLSPTPSLTLSSRSSDNCLAAAVDAAGATSQAPSDTAPTPVFAPSSEKPSSLPVPALTMSASANEGDSEVELHEVDPDMFVIKDLDSGKKYDIQKEFIIKDLTTGQMYGLDKAHSTTPDQSPTHLTDIASGRKITLDEFDGVLGHGQAFSSKEGNAQMLLSPPRLHGTSTAHQMPTAAPSLPAISQEGAAAPQGFNGLSPSGDMQPDDGRAVHSMELARSASSASSADGSHASLSPHMYRADMGPSSWSKPMGQRFTEWFFEQAKKFPQEPPRKVDHGGPTPASPASTEGIKAERVRTDEFSRHEYLNPQGVQALRSQRQ